MQVLYTISPPQMALQHVNLHTHTHHLPNLPFGKVGRLGSVGGKVGKVGRLGVEIWASETAFLVVQGLDFT